MGNITSIYMNLHINTLNLIVAMKIKMLAYLQQQVSEVALTCSESTIETPEI